MRGSWAVPILLALAFLGLFMESKSCATDVAPELVRVLEVVPSEVEVGDRVAILGEGFPPGKPARVIFRGALHRPGERPQRTAKIPVEAMVVAPTRLEFAFDDATQARFCGAGDRALHTMFEGVVEVAFAAAAPGTAPVAGVLEHVTLDVRPSASTSQDEREHEGERVLAWLGVRAVATPSGLVVDDLKQGSPAQAAGIARGDVLTSLDGLRVASAADVVPPPGEDAVTLGVRAEPRTPATSARHHQPPTPNETAVTIRMPGFRRTPPADLIAAALIVLAALAVAWLFGAPTRPLIAAALQRVLSRVRQRIGPAWSARSLVRVARTIGRATLPSYEPAAIIDIAVYAMLAAMPFAHYVVAARLDVWLLFVAGAASLATAAFVARPSALQGLRAALEIAWQHTPAAVAVASVVVTTGSLRIQEIERAQGTWPWEWLAFRSPASLIALTLLLACALIDHDAGGIDSNAHGLATLLEEAPDEARGRRKPWLEATCRAHRILVAGLATTLFLGGWHLPGGWAADEFTLPALEMGGAALLVGKTWTLTLVMAGIRWALPRPRLAHRTQATALWIAPLALVSLAGTAVWTWWSPPPVAQLLVSASLVAVVGMGAVALVRQLRHCLTSASADARLSPFL
jgi:NADH-quinone oxidoreductase subunit H